MCLIGSSGIHAGEDVTTPIFYVWPTQASFILFNGVFHASQLEPWEIVYGIGYQILWIAIFYILAKKTFYKQIVLKEA
jgi:hypothetical protein